MLSRLQRELENLRANASYFLLLHAKFQTDSANVPGGIGVHFD
jgi:hypothetical protein